MRVLRKEKQNVSKNISKKIEFAFDKVVCQEIVFNLGLSLKNIGDERDAIILFKDLDLDWDDLPVNKELEFIKKYDTNLGYNFNVLFHNIHRDFILIGQDNEVTTDINLVIIGFTKKNNNIYIKIKTFSPEVLKSVETKIRNKFKKYIDMEIRYNDNPAIITLKSLGAPKPHSKDKINTYMENKFLSISLSHYKNLFKYMVSTLDSKGYLSIKDLNKNIDGRTLGNIKQIHSLLNQYLKLHVDNNYLFLHNETPYDYKEVDKQQVFSLSARLYQYYLNIWFEDFFGEIIKLYNKEKHKYNISHTIKNWEFEFGKNKREFDWIIEVSHATEKKIIAVECKKTLSKKTLSDTKKKTKERVMNTKYHYLIDTYLIVGYFASNSNDYKDRYENNDFKFDYIKSGQSQKELYSFIGCSFNEIYNKLNKIFDEIF